MENHSRRALPPATRDTGDQKGKVSPFTQAETCLSWVDLPRTCLPGGGPHLIVRDEELHLPDLARTQDRDSPEGEPTLPGMGRVRSAEAEHNGPRVDARIQP